MSEHENGTPVPASEITEVRIAVGNEYVPPGRTELILHADGRILATTTFEGKQDRADGNVSTEQAKAFIERLTEVLDKGERDSKRTGVPDEARYTFATYQGDRKIDERRFWESEVDANPELYRLLTQLETLVKQHADSKVLLT